MSDKNPNTKSLTYEDDDQTVTLKFPKGKNQKPDDGWSDDLEILAGSIWKLLNKIDRGKVSWILAEAIHSELSDWSEGTDPARDSFIDDADRKLFLAAQTVCNARQEHIKQVHATYQRISISRQER